MIHIQRTPKPTLLVRKEIEWKDAIRNAASPKVRKKAQNKYRNAQIKDALVTMFHGKCAYCESAITHIDYGHIEHFKPKSIPAYYDLAVDWDNLLLACGRCNGSENKGVKFPSADEGGPLLNPTDAGDVPDQHFRFDFDPVLKIASVLGISARGETTWRTLGLNRPELVRRRSNFVKKLWALSAFYDGDESARALINEATNEDQEYAAFSRELKRTLDAH